MPKSNVSFRLSDQALQIIEKVAEAFGIGKAAVVEIALREKFRESGLDADGNGNNNLIMPSATKGNMDTSDRVRGNLRRIREGKGISQRELARLADIHPTQISWIETGRHVPGVDMIDKLARALNVEVSELIE
jgi:ribosome-binding protein aMBF1 (putative translation factor)